MKALNLVASFLLELVMLVCWGWWGWNLSLPAPWPALLAVAIPLVVVVLWGLFAAPRARFPLPVAGTVTLKAGLLLGGAAVLASTGAEVWAAVDALLVVLNLGFAVFWGQFAPVSAQDLRGRLLELLSDYAVLYPDEKAVVTRFRDFVASGEVLQGKENSHRHITASTWIVNPSRTKVLLTHHAKLHIWVQLGGHTDQGEDWVEAALREAREESGLPQLRLVRPGLFDLDVHEIPARGGGASHLHYDLRFLVEADDTVPLVVSEESHDLAWVEFSDLDSYTTEASQLRMRCKTPGTASSWPPSP